MPTTLLPTMKTITTKASQPQIAFLRCRPLQCAMRAATLMCFEEEMDMRGSQHLASASTTV